MDSYTFALALGGAGLVVMAASGIAHTSGHDAGGSGSGAGGHHAGADGHDVSPIPVPHHSAAAAAHSTAHATGHGTTAHHTDGILRPALLALTSPRTIFSLLVGFGLTGVVGQNFVSGLLLLTLAVLGAIGFELLIVGPLWKFLFRFASTPAASLEGSLMSEVRATSSFDANGQGLIAVEIDGQLMQCLGTLRSEDRDLGIKVRTGDRLLVEEVDASRNRCTVSYVGHARSVE